MSNRGYAYEVAFDQDRGCFQWVVYNRRTFEILMDGSESTWEMAKFYALQPIIERAVKHALRTFQHANREDGYAQSMCWLWDRVCKDRTSGSESIFLEQTDSYIISKLIHVAFDYLQREMAFQKVAEPLVWDDSESDDESESQVENEAALKLQVDEYGSVLEGESICSFLDSLNARLRVLALGLIAGQQKNTIGQFLGVSPSAVTPMVKKLRECYIAWHAEQI